MFKEADKNYTLGSVTTSLIKIQNYYNGGQDEDEDEGEMLIEDMKRMIEKGRDSVVARLSVSSTTTGSHYN